MAEPPSSWSVARLSKWLAEGERVDQEGQIKGLVIGSIFFLHESFGGASTRSIVAHVDDARRQAIDALSLCDVDGRMFLELDEEDLAESEELGLEMRSIQAIMQAQQQLEALELADSESRLPKNGSAARGVRGLPECLLPARTEPKPAPGPGGSSCPSSWPIPCVSVDKEGNSFFSQRTIDLGTSAPPGIGALSKRMPASGLSFQESRGDYEADFQPTPVKQFMVCLEAALDLEVSDGTRRTFAAGSVVLMEDTWGKGHRSRAVGGKPCRSLLITIPEDFRF